MVPLERRLSEPRGAVGLAGDPDLVPSRSEERRLVVDERDGRTGVVNRCRARWRGGGGGGRSSESDGEECDEGDEGSREHCVKKMGTWWERVWVRRRRWRDVGGREERWVTE